MSPSRLRRYLDKRSIQYKLVPHSLIATAQGVTVDVHVSRHELAKTVMVKADGELAMAIFPASLRIDLKLFKREAGFRLVKLVTEDAFHQRFPQTEAGAMPSLGSLYGVEIFADEKLSRNKEVIFNACSHHELVRMPWRDFEKLTRPKIISLAKRRRAAATAA